MLGRPLTASGERQREASTAELGSGLKPRAIGCNSYSRSRNVSRSFVVKAEHYWELKLFWSFFPILLVLLVVVVLRKLQFWVVTPPACGLEGNFRGVPTQAKQAGEIRQMWCSVRPPVAAATARQRARRRRGRTRPRAGPGRIYGRRPRLS